MVHPGEALGADRLRARLHRCGLHDLALRDSVSSFSMGFQKRQRDDAMPPSSASCGSPLPASVCREDVRSGSVVPDPPCAVSASRRRDSRGGQARAPRGKAILELSAGCARLSGACLQNGFRIATPVDIKTSPFLDITNPRILSQILDWIRQGLIWFIWLGTPCTNWCMPKRSPEAPDDIHVATAVVTIRIIKAAFRYNVK